jgi:hypothetical protein
VLGGAKGGAEAAKQLEGCRSGQQLMMIIHEYGELCWSTTQLGTHERPAIGTTRLDRCARRDLGWRVWLGTGTFHPSDEREETRGLTVLAEAEVRTHVMRSSRARPAARPSSRPRNTHQRGGVSESRAARWWR